MEFEELRTIVKAAGASHLLARGGRAYAEGFVSAFCAVHPRLRWARMLQEKFFLPDEVSFSEQAFFQNASELTIANHIRQQPVSDFAVEKRVNPTNRKDVDVWCRARSMEIAIEVKCPVEPTTDLSGINAASGTVMLIKSAGRIPNHQKQLGDFKQNVEAGGGGPVLIGKNADLALKDALVSAHAKFSPNSSVENLNVLFLSAGYVGDLNERYMSLYGTEGFFTNAPLHPASAFGLVDMIILSNLRYWHQQSAATHDWSLRDVFLLPLVNRHHRCSLMSDALDAGLSLFEHHMRRFRNFVDTHADNFPPHVREPLRLLHYINDDLSEAELKTYFPIQSHPLGRAAHAAPSAAT
jgi:hypothetical protein